MPRPGTAKVKLLQMIGGQPIQPWLGAQIAVPGIYSGMPIDYYHRGDAAIEPSISSSGLRTIFGKSAAHYWATSPYNELRSEDEDESQALLLGRAAHHHLFGQAKFEESFAIARDDLPDADGVRKPFHMGRAVCKEWARLRSEEGRSVIRLKDVATIRGMWLSLEQHPMVKNGLLNGFVETSWFWKHEKTGVWLKARPDASPNDSLDFVDLKTCPSVAWNDMQRSIYDYHYYVQAGLTAMAVREICRKEMTSFSFCFIEKTAPYDIGIVTLKENEIVRGIHAAEKAIATFAACLKSGHWPGRYADQAEARYIELSEYQQKSIDARLDHG